MIKHMESKKVILTRSAEKKRTITVNSEYVFHFSAYPVNEDIGFYEVHFKNAGQNKNLHYHKFITEIFTVLQGEFFFNTGDEEHVLRPNDTIIIPLLMVHGFRAKCPDSRLQFVFTGAEDREDFFVGLAKIANDERILTEEELEAFYNKHD